MLLPASANASDARDPINPAARWRAFCSIPPHPTARARSADWFDWARPQPSNGRSPACGEHDAVPPTPPAPNMNPATTACRSTPPPATPVFAPETSCERGQPLPGLDCPGRDLCPGRTCLLWRAAMIPEPIALRINDLVRTRPPDITADIARIVEATSRQTWIQARSVVLQSLPIRRRAQ